MRVFAVAREHIDRAPAMCALDIEPRAVPSETK